MITTADMSKWKSILPAGFTVKADGVVVGSDGTAVIVTGPSAKVIQTLLADVHTLLERSIDHDQMRMERDAAKDVSDYADDVMEALEKGCTCGAVNSIEISKS